MLAACVVSDVHLFYFQEILPGLFLGPYSAAMKSKVRF